MKHTKHSIKPYSKDLSEAQREFYNIIEGQSHTSMVPKEKEKHKGHKSCEQNKPEVY